MKSEFKKVLLRKHDQIKFIIIPKSCDIEAGQYVRITPVEEEDSEDNSKNKSKSKGKK